MLAPETRSDISEGAVLFLLVKPLVGGRRLQRSEMFDIGSHLDVVEVSLVDHLGNAQPSTVPCYLVHGVLLMDVLCQEVDTLRVGITAHEGDTGDVAAELLDESIEGISIERQPYILPKVMAVTAWTVTGTVGDVDGKCHLVGYLLEDYPRVDVLQHCLYRFLHGVLLLRSIVATCCLFLPSL